MMKLLVLTLVAVSTLTAYALPSHSRRALHNETLDALEKPRPVYRIAGADEDWEAPILTTTLEIGTPPAKFVLQVDLEFDDALLNGPLCTGVACLGPNKDRKTYDRKKSSTSKDKGEQVTLRYGSSTVKGDYLADKVTVDGIENAEVAFDVLRTANLQFSRVVTDGVFGLSLLGSPRGRKNLPSPVDSILAGSQHKIINLWFAQAKLNKDRKGLVTFGKVNAEKCIGNVQYSLRLDDDYNIRVQKVRLGKFVAHRELPARIKPSSPYLGLPTTIYKAFLRSVGSSSSTEVNCDRVKGLTVDVKIGGLFYSLQKEDFVFEKTDQYNRKVCTLLIQDNSDEFETGYDLGEPFFRRWCTTYDLENKQIGFSKSK